MKKNITLLAIVGMPGSGKTVSAHFFKKNNIPVLRFGDQTDIGLKELGLTRNEHNERGYREKLRKEFGMAAYAIKTEPRINLEAKRSEFIILDGLYSWEEYIYLKKRFPQLKLLCIYAEPEVRYNRLTTRTVRPLSRKEARERDIAELVNLNKGGPIALADYLIENNTDVDSLNKKLSLLLDRVKNE